jgi:hypothetical protein
VARGGWRRCVLVTVQLQGAAVMTPLVADMALVLAVWGIAWCTFVGLGQLIARVLRWPLESRSGVVMSFWLGWSLALGVLQVWHLAFPVGWRCRVILLLLAALGVEGRLGLLARALRGRSAESRLRLAGLAVAVVAFAALLANQALLAPGAYEVGLHQLQSVRWAESFAIVPGLANLNRYFGFNSTYPLYVALMDVGLWGGESIRLANGLLLLALFLGVLSGVWLSRPQEQESIWVAWVNLLLLTPIVFLASTSSVASPTLAPVLSCVGMAQFLFLLRLAGSRSTDEAGAEVRAVTVIAAAGSTLGLSFATFGWTSSLAAALLARRQGAARSRPAAMMTALVVLFLLIPWLARSVLLSGYLAYPLTFSSVPVEWRVPEACLQSTVVQIQSWARDPGPDWDDDIDTWRWLLPWVRRMSDHRHEVVIPMMLAVLGASVLLVRRRRGYATRAPIPWLVAPGLAGLAVWLVTVPEPRDALASFWVPGSALGASAFAALQGRGKQSLAFALGLMFALLPVRRISLASAREPIPVGKAELAVTEGNVPLRVPVDDERCWDARLPCAPRPKRGLALRTSRGLSGGFVVHWNDAEAECRFADSVQSE